MHSINTDVVIVGGGAAGCVTAGVIASFAPGQHITLLEIDCSADCNSTIASAFIPGAATRFQKQQGILDTPEAMAADICAKNHGESDYEITLSMCRHSANALHWMADIAHVPIEFAGEIHWLGHNTPRMHSHKLRSGIPIIRCLHTFLEKSENIHLLDHTTAREIERTSKGAFRVKALSDGRELDIVADFLVLATGGFGGNPGMIKQYIPDMTDAWHIGAATNTGDGIRWGLTLGGETKLMNAFQGRDTIREDGTRVTPGVISEGGIAVNNSGVRFVREDLGYSPLSTLFRAQDGKFVFLLWDERIQGKIADLYIMIDALEKGEIHSFSDVKQLSEFFDLPGDRLKDTLDTYNLTPIGVQDEFGRVRETPVLRPPFYASRVTGSIAHTQGGLTINKQSQVIDESGTSINHVYAVGNDAVGLSGAGSDGYLSGNGWFFAITSGFAAGRAIARELTQSTNS
jgi:fumarate reductase flavoprotein subunit